MSEKDVKVLEEMLITANKLTPNERKQMLRFGQGMVAGKQNAMEEKEKESSGE